MNIEIPFELVVDQRRLEEIMASMSHHPRYAIDTEFDQRSSYFANLALVQIGWPDFVALVDPLRVEMHSLAPLFESSALALAHAATNDLGLLRRATGAVPRQLFDTEVAGQLLGRPRTSLAALCDEYLGVDLDKSEQTRDWLRRPLPESALAYAAHDVVHLFDLADVLAHDLDECGRLQAHAQECAALLDEHENGDDAKTLWWRIKDLQRADGATQLRGQFLCAARDVVARDLNLVRNHVIGDDLVVQWARQAPPSRQQVATSLSSSVDSSEVDVLWRSLQEASHASVGDLWPSDADPANGPEGIRLTLARLYVRCVADQWRISPSTMASHRDLVKFFRYRPSRIDMPWRIRAIGDDLALLRSDHGALQVVNDELVIVDTTTALPRG